MQPTLFELGPFPIRAYGVMMVLGFLVSVTLAGWRARKCGADEDFVLNLGLIALIVGIIGARAFYIIHRWRQYAAHPEPIRAILDVTAGGLEFYGGFLAAVAAVIGYIVWKRRSIRWYMDILAPSIMVGLAFGRMGCFLNGCCWGATTELPWGIRCPYGSLAFDDQVTDTHELAVPAEFLVQGPDGHAFLVPRDVYEMSDEEFQAEVAEAEKNPNSPHSRVMLMTAEHLRQYDQTITGLHELVDTLDIRCRPVHPTQLYSLINALLIAWVLGMYFRVRRRQGMVLGMLFVIYPISRFVLEAIRTDNPLDTFGGLTVSQGVSVLVIPLAVVYMLVLRRLPEVSPASQREFAHANKADESGASKT